MPARVERGKAPLAAWDCEGCTMRARALLLMATVGIVVAACGTQATPGEGRADTPRSRSSSASTGPADPLGLIGVWQVSGTDEAAGTLLRFDATELSLWRACGVLYGSWRADEHGRFVADAGQSADGTCVTAKDTALTLRPHWLMAAASFRVDGDVRVLLDDRGAVAARLEPATGSRPGDGSRSPFTDPPSVDEHARRSFEPPAPLPGQLSPATEATVLGRWMPIGVEPAQRPRVPFLRLAADRTWSSSDGCNGSMGRWTIGSAGRVLATSGISTLIACHNVPVDQWWTSATRAGFDGRTLVLVDATGGERARFVR